MQPREQILQKALTPVGDAFTAREFAFWRPFFSRMPFSVGFSLLDSYSFDMTADQLAKAQYEFFKKGEEFFTWFSGKNTPNILEMIGHQIGALEVALKVQTDRRVVKMTYVVEEELAKLTATVCRHLGEGWQPYGNLSVSNSDGTIYLQTMVQYSERPVRKARPNE